MKRKISDIRPRCECNSSNGCSRLKIGCGVAFLVSILLLAGFSIPFSFVAGSALLGKGEDFPSSVTFSFRGNQQKSLSVPFAIQSENGEETKNNLWRKGTDELPFDIASSHPQDHRHLTENPDTGDQPESENASDEKVGSACNDKFRRGIGVGIMIVLSVAFLVAVFFLCRLNTVPAATSDKQQPQNNAAEERRAPSSPKPRQEVQRMPPSRSLIFQAGQEGTSAKGSRNLGAEIEAPNLKSTASRQVARQPKPKERESKSSGASPIERTQASTSSLPKGGSSASASMSRIERASASTSRNERASASTSRIERASERASASASANTRASPTARTSATAGATAGASVTARPSATTTASSSSNSRATSMKEKSTFSSSIEGLKKSTLVKSLVNPPLPDLLRYSRPQRPKEVSETLDSEEEES